MKIALSFLNPESAITQIPQYIDLLERYAGSEQKLSSQSCLKYLIKGHEMQEQQLYCKPSDSPFSGIEEYFKNLGEYTKRMSVTDLQSDQFYPRIIAWLYYFEPYLVAASIPIPDNFKAVLTEYRICELTGFLNDNNNTSMREAGNLMLGEFAGHQTIAPERLETLLDNLIENLEDNNLSVRRAANQALCQIAAHQDLTASQINKMLNGLCEQKNKHAFALAGQALGQLALHQDLTTKQFQAALNFLFKLLQDNNDYIYRNVAQSVLEQIGTHPDLTIIQLNTLLDEFIGSFSIRDLIFLEDVIKILKQIVAHSSLGPGRLDAFLDKFISIIDDKDSFVRKGAFQALGQYAVHQKLSVNKLDILLSAFSKCLSDKEDKQVRQTVTQELCRVIAYQDLTEEQLRIFSDKFTYPLLSKEDDSLCDILSWVLIKINTYPSLADRLNTLLDVSVFLPDITDLFLLRACQTLYPVILSLNLTFKRLDSFLDRFICFFQNLDIAPREIVRATLGRIIAHPNLTPKQFNILLNKLIACLGDQNSYMRLESCLVLENITVHQNLVPEQLKILQSAFTDCLDDKVQAVRVVAKRALYRITDTLPTSWEELIELLGNKDLDKREEAEKKLSNIISRSDLNPTQLFTYVNNLIECLYHEDPNVRKRVCSLLVTFANHQHLTSQQFHKLMNALISCLGDTNEEVRQNATKTFCKIDTFQKLTYEQLNILLSILSGCIYDSGVLMAMNAIQTLIQIMACRNLDTEQVDVLLNAIILGHHDDEISMPLFLHSITAHQNLIPKQLNILLDRLAQLLRYGSQKVYELAPQIVSQLLSQFMDTRFTPNLDNLLQALIDHFNHENTNIAKHAREMLNQITSYSFLHHEDSCIRALTISHKMKIAGREPDKIKFHYQFKFFVMKDILIQKKCEEHLPKALSNIVMRYLR